MAFRARTHAPLAFLGFVLLALVLTPGLFTGAMVWDERLSEYIPWRVEAARIIASGEFPFFTDRVFGGMPLFATAYTGVLYPPNLLYLLFPAWIANVLEAFHSFLAGAGMFLYLRSRRLSPWASSCGGALFMTSSFLLHHTGHVSMREAACLAPWVALAGRRLLLVPGAGRLAAFAAMVALQMAVGYPQIVLMTAFWLLADWLASARIRRAWWVAPVLLFGGFSLGVAMLMAQIQPSLEHAKETPRVDMTDEDRLVASFAPQLGILMFQPRALEALDYEWGGESFPGEWGGAPYPVLMALAIIPLLLLTRRRFRRSHRARLAAVYWAFLLFCLLISLGRHFPPAMLLLEQPPFSLFRVPSRWLFLVTVFAVVLAALGLDWLTRLRPARRAGFAVAAFLLLAVAAVACWFVPGAGHGEADRPPLWTLLAGTTQEPGFPFSWWEEDGAWIVTSRALQRREWQPLLALVLLLVLAVPGRWREARAAVLLLLLAAGFKLLLPWELPPPRDRPWLMDPNKHPLLGQVDRSAIQRLYPIAPLSGEWGYAKPSHDMYPHNIHLLAGVRGLQGYTPLYSRRVTYALRMGQTGAGWRDHRHYDNPTALQSIGVSHVLVEEARLDEASREGWERGLRDHYEIVARHGGDVLARLVEVAPRFQLAGYWGPAEETWLAEMGLDDRVTDPPGRAVAYVEDPPWRQMPPHEVTLPGGTVEVLEDRTSRQRVRVLAPPEGAFLLIRDVHWRGWYYRIPGTELGERWNRQLRVQGLFRGVPVPPGEHVVEMAYRQPGFRKGLTFSLIALAGWLGIAAFAVVRRRGRRAD